MSRTLAIAATVAFYAKHREGWHSYDPADKPTVRAIEYLAEYGFLDVNRPCRMARFTGKTSA